MQCIQSYTSLEPDELSIEMADVLNLLERTDDGTLLWEFLWTLVLIVFVSFTWFEVEPFTVAHQAGCWVSDCMTGNGDGSPVEWLRRSTA